MRTTMVLLPVALLVLAVPASGSELIVLDEFDDGVLDPAWEIILQDAEGWTYAESGTELSVSDIDPTVINAGGGGTWAVVRIGRSCAALYDLHADFDFSWDCLGVDEAMQYVRLALLDGNGELLAAAGYSDPWFADCGCRLAGVGTEWECQWGELSFEGSASVEIDRTGEDMTIRWDDSPILTGTTDVPVERIEIQFGFYATERTAGDSIFGNEAIDLVRVEGDPVSVDPTGWGRVKSRYR